MSILPIIIYGDDPDNLLRNPTIMVSQRTLEVVGIVTDLKDSLNAPDRKLVGLAANQIGYNKSICITKQRGIFINPKIIPMDGQVLPTKDYSSREACGSIPGIIFNVMRWKTIRVLYLDETMTEHDEIIDDYDAIVLQHEIDHLNGLTLFDRSPSRAEYEQWLAIRAAGLV